MISTNGETKYGLRSFKVLNLGIKDDFENMINK